ncbi:phage baseplate plug family protein [Xenorhabdus stockiae]|uniref:phage baseplate plug family protein n=1 Tax=Xenorhabdus stockiae TaxID=351614 RepID=UPI003CFB0D2B
MNIVEIPLQAENQQFDIQLGGINYRMRLQHRDSAGWILDIMHPNSEPIVSGLPLVFGVDILEQHRYLGFNGVLIFHYDDLENETNKEELGKNNRLYFITGIS